MDHCRVPIRVREACRSSGLKVLHRLAQTEDYSHDHVAQDVQCLSDWMWFWAGDQREETLETLENCFRP